MSSWWEAGSLPIRMGLQSNPFYSLTALPSCEILIVWLSILLMLLFKHARCGALCIYSVHLSPSLSTSPSVFLHLSYFLSFSFLFLSLIFPLCLFLSLSLNVGRGTSALKRQWALSHCAQADIVPNLLLYYYATHSGINQWKTKTTIKENHEMDITITQYSSWYLKIAQHYQPCGIRCVSKANYWKSWENDERWVIYRWYADWELWLGQQHMTHHIWPSLTICR